VKIEKKAKRAKKGKARPHRGYYSFELRLKAVKLYLEEGYSSEMIAEELGIAHGTVFAWAKRYREEGEDGLRSRYPGKRKPSGSEAAKKKAVEIKKANPEYGSRRISHLLRRVFLLGPSHETVRKALKEEDLVKAPKRKPKRNMTRPRFFERSRPNQLWQTDIFTFKLGGRYAYLIGYIDDYSRYITGLGLYRSQKADQVLEVFRRAGGEYGVPKEMLTDNGRQYTNWRGTSRFEKELKKDQIKHIKSAPHHPMTLGKIERFWKTIFTEFLSRVQFDSFDEAEERLKLWVKYYNHKRPHQGIKGLCPADRYFEIATEMRETLERGIADNTLETALRGQPKEPFYMVGRLGEQSVVIRAEKGKVRMMVDGKEAEEKKEMIYDIEGKTEAESDEGTGEQGQTEQADLQCSTEVSGGAEPVEREAQAVGTVPGNGRKMGECECLAGESPSSDDGGAGTEESKGGGPGSCLGAEAGEAADENEPEAEQRDEVDQAPGATAGEQQRGVDSPMPPNGYALLSQDEARIVAEFLAQRRAEMEARIHESKEERPRAGCPQESGVDPEGSERPVDGNRSGQNVGDQPQDVLQVGEPSVGSDVGIAEGSPLRATLSPGRWREEELGEDGGGYEEAAVDGGTEGTYTDLPS